MNDNYIAQTLFSIRNGSCEADTIYMSLDVHRKLRFLACCLHDQVEAAAIHRSINQKEILSVCVTHTHTYADTVVESRSSAFTRVVHTAFQPRTGSKSSSTTCARPLPRRHVSASGHPHTVLPLVMPSPTPPPSDVVGSLSCVALPRLLPLFLGVSCGASLALVVALTGVRSSALVQWLLRVPGDLLLQALVAVTFPLVALHATRTGSLLQTRQLSILWMRLALATLAASTMAALVASTVGALVAAALHGVLPRSAALLQVWGLPLSSAAVAFRCPGDVSSGSVTLQSNGSLVCSSNATTFMIDDVAHTFVAGAMTQKAWSVSEQVVTMVESAFPESAAGAFVDGDVLSVMVGGLALGAALACCSSWSEKRHESDQNDGRRRVDEELEPEEQLMILQLVKEAEAAACRLLSWLQTHLSISVVFMVSSVLLRPSVPVPIHDSEESFTALALVTVLLLALVLDVVVMIVLATLFTLSNPFAFLEHLLPAQLLALSSGSSVVALPATVSAIVASKRVSPPVAFIVCCTSTVLGQTGTALYLSLSTLFVLSASASGTSEDEQSALRSTSTICVMVLANVIGASVTSPLPGNDKTAALATAFGVVFGVPTGPRAVLLSYLAATDWIIAPFVACVNVTNNALITLVIGHYFEARSVPTTETSYDGTASAAIHQLLPLDQRQQQIVETRRSED